jgi:hypothetical protein
MELTEFVAMLVDEGGRPTREAVNILVLCTVHVPQFEMPTEYPLKKDIK